LFKQGLLGDKFYIIGFSRRDISDSEFRDQIGKHFAEIDSTEWQRFSENLYYQQGKFEEVAGYSALVKRLEGFDLEIGACITRLFYLATPPDNYNYILDHLLSTKLSEGCGQGSGKWTKVIIEKPFGKDLESAKTLDLKLATIFNEEQIFRADHYLGKDTVQNMLAFRFANGIFDPVWNNKYIDHVQITLHEKNGVGRRGKFFDGVGNLRDVAQNHLMQLIAAVAMEQPKSFVKEAIRDARANAIKAMCCLEIDDVSKSVVRAQYNGYKNEENVDPDSQTETYVAMKLFIDTPRLENVPFYVRAGKKMDRDVVEISIVFIQTCHILFKEYGCPEIGNVLTIRIQPDEGISLRVVAKNPGTKVSLGTVDMKFSYHESFKTKGTEAYEKILLEIFAGDQTLFNRSDELESSWTFITKILEGWKKYHSPLVIYDDNSNGPKEAQELIEKDGKKWL